MEKFLDAIRAERAHQDEKWGKQRNLNDNVWLAILLEEIGEVAKQINEQGMLSLDDSELIQSAAVIVAWLECIERNSSNHNEPPPDPAIKKREPPRPWPPPPPPPRKQIVT